MHKLIAFASGLRNLQFQNGKGKINSYGGEETVDTLLGYPSLCSTEPNNNFIIIQYSVVIQYLSLSEIRCHLYLRYNIAIIQITSF